MNENRVRLEKPDIDQLLEYFHVGEAVCVRSAQETAVQGPVDFVALYGRLAGKVGRNNALYRAASVARVEGIEKADLKKGAADAARGGAGSAGPQNGDC